MHKKALILTLLGFIMITMLAALPALAQQAEKPVAPAPDQAKEQEAFDLGVEAYIYGYPLVTMEMTRRVMTNVAEPEGNHAPMGQFARLREYPDAVVQGRHGPQRGHALLDGLAGPGQGALGPEPAGR